MQRYTIAIAVGWFCGVLTYEHSMIAIGLGVVCAWFMRQRSYQLACAVSLCACACGYMRIEQHYAITLPQNERLTTQAVEVQNQKNTWEYQQITVTDVRNRRYIIKLPLSPQYVRGSKLVVSGDIALWKQPLIDYHRQLRRQRVIGELHDVIIHEAHINDTVMGHIEQVRQSFWYEIHRYFPEPVASVVVGMLLGIADDVDTQTAAAFRTSGTSHILVISGWNITIVASLCLSIITQFKPHRIIALIAPLLVVGLYVVFTGASAAVVRAGVMGGIIIVGKWLNRPRGMFNIIVIAVVLISIVDPAAIWDIGMQLSTVATIGLVAFATPIDTLLARSLLRSPYLAWAREGLSSTIAAQITTLPIMVCRLGAPTIWSLLANTIITPVVPLAMACGTIFLVATFIHPLIAYAVAWVAYPSFAWIVTGSQVLATWPHTGQNVLTFTTAWVEVCLHGIWIVGWYGLRQFDKKARQQAN